MMRKLLLFFAMLCVSVGAWADVTAKLLANSQNNASNGKGFTFTHTAYQVNVEHGGDLASANVASIADSENENNKINLNTATYLVFTGKLNADDLAAINANVGNSSNDVYLDFSSATFVEGATIADLSKQSIAKYIILPDGTSEISTDLPSSVTEVLAYNGNKLLGHSVSGGALEHVLWFDRRFAESGNTITDYTLSGTYTYIQDTNVTRGTYSTSGKRNSVFGVMQLMEQTGYQGNANIVNLDLRNAVFPNYTDEPKLYTATEGASTTWTGPTNGMELINIYSSSLESVILPETDETTLIPYQAFYNCSKISSLEIPGNIKTLGMEAFYSLTGAETITFNVGLETMAPDVFLNCTSVTSISLPVGLKNIGKYAFIKCTSLKELVIPEGVEVIEAGAFEQTDIKTVRLPNSLKRIEMNAFRQCQKLVTMTFPENLEYIGEDAFRLCYGLEDVYFLGTTTIPEVHANAFDGQSYANSGGLASGGETYTSESWTYGNYPNALIAANTGTRKKVDMTSWATYDSNGVKTSGATVLHYPLVSAEAGYTETDYAASYAAYQTELDAYNTAVAGKADEVAAYEADYAKYLQDLAVWNEVSNMPLYWDQNGNAATAQNVKEYSSNDFYTSQIGGYVKLDAAWQIEDSNYKYNKNKGYTYYTKDDSGEYVICNPQPANQTDAATYISGNGLYAYTPDETIYVKITDEQKSALIAGEPTAPTPVEGVPTKPTAPVVYTKSGDSYVEYSGAPESGVTYYKAVAANNDVYGEYYTDTQRNANYGGIYRGDEGDGFDKTHGLTTWPTFWDFGVWTENGQQFARTGLSTPDGVNRDGLKNFILVSGFPVDPSVPDNPVKTIEHIKKDVWYTMCFPFDLTDTQLQSCFGAGYEVAQFKEVVVNGSSYVLNFTTAVEPDANGKVTSAHVPYMIHPNSMSVNEDGTPKNTVFTLTGVSETQEDHDADQAIMLENAVTATDSNGKVFTFIGYGHNYENSKVLLPKYSFFLGTKSGEIYPKFWRQTGDNDRASGGYWNKNVAIVLPPTYEYSKIDEREINSDKMSEEDSYVLLSTLRGEDGYWNYVCSEYVPDAITGAGAKAVSNFEIMFTNDPIEINNETTAIQEIQEDPTLNVRPAMKGKVYGLNGQLVGNSLVGLPKGVYVVNGKKYVVK